MELQWSDENHSRQIGIRDRNIPARSRRIFETGSKKEIEVAQGSLGTLAVLALVVVMICLTSATRISSERSFGSVILTVLPQSQSSFENRQKKKKVSNSDEINTKIPKLPFFIFFLLIYSFFY